jgi:hypothetical protein
MNAAFMSFQLHGCGIHVVRPGTGVTGVTGARFSCAPGNGETRADMGAAAMQ